MKFERLKFYDTGHARVEAIVMFANNHGAKVEQGVPGGSFEDDTYRLSVLVALKPHSRGTLGGKNADVAVTYETPVTDDVLENLTRSEVEHELDQIADLPRRSFDAPRPRSIAIYVSRSTPPEEDEEYGETESEFEGNHPIALDEYDLDEGRTVADVAASFIRDEGGREASSGSFHSGIWYMSGYETVDYGTGEEEERTFHLEGFTEDEEREVYERVTRRRR